MVRIQLLVIRNKLLQNKVINMKNTIHQMLSRIHVFTGKTLSLHDLKLVAKHLTLAENIFE